MPPDASQWRRPRRRRRSGRYRTGHRGTGRSQGRAARPAKPLIHPDTRATMRAKHPSPPDKVIRSASAACSRMFPSVRRVLPARKPAAKRQASAKIRVPTLTQNPRPKAPDSVSLGPGFCYSEATNPSVQISDPPQPAARHPYTPSESTARVREKLWIEEYSDVSSQRYFNPCRPLVYRLAHRRSCMQWCPCGGEHMRAKRLRTSDTRALEERYPHTFPTSAIPPPPPAPRFRPLFRAQKQDPRHPISPPPA